MNTGKFWVLHIISEPVSKQRCQACWLAAGSRACVVFLVLFLFSVIHYGESLSRQIDFRHVMVIWVDAGYSFKIVVIRKRLNFIHFPREIFWWNLCFLISWICCFAAMVNELYTIRFGWPDMERGTGTALSHSLPSSWPALHGHFSRNVWPSTS